MIQQLAAGEVDENRLIGIDGFPRVVFILQNRRRGFVNIRLIRVHPGQQARLIEIVGRIRPRLADLIKAVRVGGVGPDVDAVLPAVGFVIHDGVDAARLPLVERVGRLAPHAYGKEAVGRADRARSARPTCPHQDRRPADGPRQIPPKVPLNVTSPLGQVRSFEKA